VTRALLAIVLLASLASAGAAAAGQPRINDATGHEMTTPENDTPTEATDRRPFFVAGGVAVLAAIFVWNRRRRAALERQSEDETRRLRAEARAARAESGGAEPVAAEPDDPDAADLREAARSDQEPT
jgi:peptidoglycan/LPS O-acetylase OafA/YrhL